MKKSLLCLLLVLSLVWLAGCGGQQAPAPAPEEPAGLTGEGSAVIIDDWEMPAFQPPIEYAGNAGFTEQVLLSTGPRLATIAPDGTFLREIIPTGLGYFDFPRLSPDGTQFVVFVNYHEWTEPWETILLGDMATGQTTELNTAGAYYYYPPSWSHDGSQIIYSAYDEDWVGNIYYTDVNTGESGIFVDLSDFDDVDQEALETATLHPTKELLYFVAWSDSADEYAVYEYDLAADDVRMVWSVDEPYVFHIAVSPRDDLLLVSAGIDITEDEITTFGMYIVDTATGEGDLLFWEDGLQVIMADFSPDGSQAIMCVDTRIIENTWSQYLYDVDANTATVVSRYVYDSAIEPFSPSWGIIP
ncbi:MAG: hypothetical protein SCK57_05175 [Bacillota bacterium]|nr:hypothetical protein [Bacillota bacterium]MDW7677032.1 hypothetical protein [Bacillota bacterium]